MPYGYSDRDWQSMTQGIKQSIKEEWGRDHSSTNTGKLINSGSYVAPGTKQSYQQSGTTPSPSYLDSTTVTLAPPQSSFDPSVYIRELQEEQTRQQIAALNAAKTKPIRGLSKAMTKAIG